MRNCIKLFAALVLLQIFSGCNGDQFKDHGVFRYSSRFVDSVNLTKTDSLNMGDIVFAFRGDESRWNFQSKFRNSFSVLYNHKTHWQAALINKGRERNAFVTDHPDSYYKGLSEIKFVYVDDTKEICGYKCKKAIYKDGMDTTQLYVYYTPDIKAPLTPNLYRTFHDLKGYPMEFSKVVYWKKLVTRITDLSSEKVDRDLFKIPKEYNIINFDDESKNKKGLNLNSSND